MERKCEQLLWESRTDATESSQMQPDALHMIRMIRMMMMILMHFQSGCGGSFPIPNILFCTLKIVFLQCSSVSDQTKLYQQSLLFEILGLVWDEVSKRAVSLTWNCGWQEKGLGG